MNARSTFPAAASQNPRDKTKYDALFVIVVWKDGGSANAIGKCAVE